MLPEVVKTFANKNVEEQPRQCSIEQWENCVFKFFLKIKNCHRSRIICACAYSESGFRPESGNDKSEAGRA